MNLRPSGYEPDELPDCSTPHQIFTNPLILKDKKAGKFPAPSLTRGTHYKEEMASRSSDMRAVGELGIGLSFGRLFGGIEALVEGSESLCLKSRS